MSNAQQSANVVADLMKEASTAQASVHAEIAKSEAASKGSGTMIVKLYLFGGSLSGSFDFGGVVYSFTGKMAGGGWAGGTSTGSIVATIDPSSLVGDVGFDGRMNGSDISITFHKSGVAVATYQGTGISGGGGVAGSGTWKRGG